MPSLFSRNKDTEREITQSGAATGSTTPAPPSYGDDATPPSYKASSYLRSLHEGDPNDKVEVPMIHSTHKLSFGDYLPWGSAGKTGKRTVISRSMTRDCYLKHYAKDEEGRYIGTERPYPDWQLVFVPTKGTPDDILQQVCTHSCFTRCGMATLTRWQLNEFVDARHDIRRLHDKKELKHISQ